MRAVAERLAAGRGARPRTRSARRRGSRTGGAAVRPSGRRAWPGRTPGRPAPASRSRAGCRRRRARAGDRRGSCAAGVVGRPRSRRPKNSGVSGWSASAAIRRSRACRRISWETSRPRRRRTATRRARAWRAAPPGPRRGGRVPGRVPRLRTPRLCRARAGARAWKNLQLLVGLLGGLLARAVAAGACGRGGAPYGHTTGTRAGARVGTRAWGHVRERCVPRPCGGRARRRRWYGGPGTRPGGFSAGPLATGRPDDPAGAAGASEEPRRKPGPRNRVRRVGRMVRSGHRPEGRGGFRRWYRSAGTRPWRTGQAVYSRGPA